MKWNWNGSQGGTVVEYNWNISESRGGMEVEWNGSGLK